MRQYTTDGRMMDHGPMNNGPWLYTATLQFSDHFQKRDDSDPTDNPWHWDWAGLIDQPDARVIGVAETPNPHYPRALDVLSLAVGALRDYEVAAEVARDTYNVAEGDESALVAAGEAEAVADGYASVLADNVRSLLALLGVKL